MSQTASNKKWAKMVFKIKKNRGDLWQQPAMDGGWE